MTTATDSGKSAINRRQLLGGLGALGLAAVIGRGETASAQTGPTDADILNFALNLEYLEAEYYARAVGARLRPAQVGGGAGQVVGGRTVPFAAYRDLAREIARDELAHVVFLRQALGGAAVSRPAINFNTAFTAAARAAGLVGPNQQFDAFANEDNFLLGAFVFEDVGVTAYRGAAPLIDDPNTLSAAAGILGVEAYHAGAIRQIIAQRGGQLAAAANAISNARDSLDGASDLDQPVTIGQANNVVPTDANGLAFARTPSQVLKIVYLTNANGVSQGGFFPNGVNGTIKTT